MFESISARMESNGFCIIGQCLDNIEIAALLEILSRVKDTSAAKRKNGAIYGIRDVLNQVPELRSFASNKAIHKLITAIFDSPARLIRAIYFDKTEHANWGVLWHQDTTIATRDKTDVAGFHAWTVKTGIHHVRPPVEYIQRMVTLRIHLDDCTEDNGALKVIPASHLNGFLAEKQISKLTKDANAIICEAQKGSIMAMKPCYFTLRLAVQILHIGVYCILNFLPIHYPPGWNGMTLRNQSHPGTLSRASNSS